MLPSFTTYSQAEVAAMSIDDKVKIADLVFEQRDYLDALSAGTDIAEAVAFCKWLGNIERQMRVLPMPLRLRHQEFVARSMRAVGQVLRNARELGLLADYRHAAVGNRPTLADYGLRSQDLPRHAKAFADVDDETFETLIAKGYTARNVSANHLHRALVGQAGTDQDRRVRGITEWAAEGKTSNEIAEIVGYAEGYQVRKAAERYGIDIPGDRDPAVQMRSRMVTRSADGFSARNYHALANALGALEHLLSDGDGQLHPDVTPDQAEQWARRLSDGRTQLTRLINTLKEAGKA